MIHSAGRQARMGIRPIRTGDAGGLVGQAIAAFAALGAVVFIWTGFALSWRRFFKRNGENAETPKPRGDKISARLGNAHGE